MSQFMRFDKEKAEKVVVLPAGRRTCLMCEKESRNSHVLKLTPKFKCRLCPRCWKEYEKAVSMWIGKNGFKRI